MSENFHISGTSDISTPVIKQENGQDSGEMSFEEKNSASKRKNLDYSSDDSSESHRDKRIRFIDNRDDKKQTKAYVLTLSHLPGEWTYSQIKQYVSDECGVNVTKMLDSRSQKSDYQLRLRFTDENQYRTVLGKLRKKESEGKLKLHVEDQSDSDSDSSEKTVQIGQNTSLESNATTSKDNPKPNIDIWDCNSLFGLSPSFLKSLGIKPPLTKWIIVTNFRCDKSELRDVFEMAGHVALCVVTQTINKYAKIMYRHPLEAVQAVSMLNGQTFYGQQLKVTLDPLAEMSLPQPKGLTKFGPGLGQLGKPVRDIVTEFERYIKGQPTEINTNIFATSQTDSQERYSPSNPSVDEKSPMSPNLGQTNQPSKVPVFNPLNMFAQAQNIKRPLLDSPPIEQYRYNGPNMAVPNFQNQFQNPNYPNQAGPNQGQFGPNLGPYNFLNPNNMTRPFAPGMPVTPVYQNNFGPRPVAAPMPVQSGPVQNQGQSIRSNIPLMPKSSLPSVMVLKGKDARTLNITNLPGHVTFASLSDKLSKVGEVVFLQFTSPGCAVAQFATPEQADQCFKYYSPSKYGHELGMAQL